MHRAGDEWYPLVQMIGDVITLDNDMGISQRARYPVHRSISFSASGGSSSQHPLEHEAHSCELSIVIAKRAPEYAMIDLYVITTRVVGWTWVATRVIRQV